MFWFRKRKPIDEEMQAREAEIKAIHEESLKQIDQTAKSVKKSTKMLNKLLDDPTYRIFLATGGEKRNGR